jgi:hypothetical protein
MLFFNNVNNWTDLGKKIHRRIKTILVPFLVWNIISMLWSYMISIIPITRSNINVRDLFTFTLDNVLKGLFLSKYNMHNWYLAQLIIFVSISPMVYYFIENKRIGVSFLMLIFGLYMYGIKIPLFLQDFCGIYYFSGCYIGKHFLKEFVLFSESPNRKRLKEAVLYFFLFVITQYYAFFYDLNHTNAGLLWYIAAISFWLLINCINLNDKKVFNYSFFIYLAHFIVAPCVNKMIWLFFPHNEFFLLFTLIGGSFITIVLIIITGSFIKKVLPLLWMILTGESIGKKEITNE